MFFSSVIIYHPLEPVGARGSPRPNRRFWPKILKGDIINGMGNINGMAIRMG
jgi:hypothetical protein